MRDVPKFISDNHKKKQSDAQQEREMQLLDICYRTRALADDMVAVLV